MFVIKNRTDKPLLIDHVCLDPHQQLSVMHVTPGMEAAQDAGTLQIKDADETLAERKADTAAIDSFKP